MVLIRLLNNLKIYTQDLIKAIESIDLKQVSKVEKLITKKILLKKKIFTCGNGGAASVANHFLCDFNKGIKISSKNKIKPKTISFKLTIIIQLGIY